MRVVRLAYVRRSMLCVTLAFAVAYPAAGQSQGSAGRSPAELSQQMQKYEKEGHLDRAVEIGNELLRSYPDRYNLLWYLASIHARLGNRDKAIELYDSALSKAPPDKVAAIQADLKAKYGIVRGANPSTAQTAGSTKANTPASVGIQRSPVSTASVASACDAAIAAHRRSARSTSGDALFVDVVTACQGRREDIAAESVLAYGGEASPRTQRHFEAALAGDVGRYERPAESSNDSSIAGTLLGLAGSVALGKYAVRQGADPAAVTNTIMNTVVAPPKDGQVPFDVRNPLGAPTTDASAVGAASVSAAPSGACPANLKHIAPKLPMYRDQQLLQVRQSVLDEDIATVMAKIRSAGMTPSAGARRMMSDAKAWEEQAVRAEACVRAVTTTPEPVLQSLRQGTFQLGGRGTIQDDCAKSYVNAYYGAVGSKELAVVVACHASLAK